MNKKFFSYADQPILDADNGHMIITGIYLDILLIS